MFESLHRWGTRGSSEFLSFQTDYTQAMWERFPHVLAFRCIREDPAKVGRTLLCDSNVVKVVPTWWAFQCMLNIFWRAHDILIDSCYNCCLLITKTRRECPVLFDTILGVVLMREMKKTQ
jgi:hypothetical protein